LRISVEKMKSIGIEMVEIWPSVGGVAEIAVSLHADQEQG